MRIILTDDVVGVGDIGDIVKVRAGYARNFLIPTGVAIEAASANARQVAHHQRQIDAKKKRLQTAAEARGKELQGLKPELSLRVGSGGKVFGSITSRDIAAKLSELGFEIDRRRVLLGDPLKRIGAHKVKVKLHADVVTEIEISLVPTQASSAEEAQEAEAARIAFESKVAEAQEGAEEDDALDQDGIDDEDDDE
jgi:large subunit ribosomal protein L9